MHYSKNDKLEIGNDIIDAIKQPEVRSQKSEDRNKKSEEVSASVFDLFKTTNKSNELSERAKESIVLKFE